MVKNKLRIILAERYMKMTDLCKLTGINKGTMFNIYHNNFKCINIEHLCKLCEVLDVKFEELFEYKPD